jgi:hypothetical protein
MATNERDPFKICEIPDFITVDAAKDGQYMNCKRCNDFQFLPWSMGDEEWFRAVQDFAFTHDRCTRRRDLSV